MSRPIYRWPVLALIACALTLVGLTTTEASASPPPEEEPRVAGGFEFFESRIRPVLEKRCYRCHSAKTKKPKGGLRLDTRAAIRRGGDTGPAIVRGDVDRSLLIEALRYESIEMPPKEKLPDSVIADFAAWVKMGAPYPLASEEVSREESVEGRSAQDEARRFWSFQPVRRPPLPAVRDQRWPRTPIDAFILSTLEANDLAPAPAANRRDLIRRVYFDVTGLPPTPEHVATFVKNESPDAYEKLVDRLLASFHYGERWAQHWLDLVRFAETEGFEYDRIMPGSWRYRDYVIRAFGADKPYDQFVTEQLAGDEFAPTRRDALVAAGFHRLGAVRRNAGNQEVASSRNEILTERTDIVATAFLGLTVGCARCHDHKFDPVPQADYYQLQAFLAATREHDVPLASPAEVATWEQKKKAVDVKIARLKKQAKNLEGQAEATIKEELKSAELERPPALPTLCTIRNDEEKRTQIHVLVRGVWESKGERVGMRPLSVLVPDETPELPLETRNPRTLLARWITDPKHPLTARVMVNRIWSHHFGLGIVKTPNDFGHNGDRPRHPELLDYLAAEFVAGGWRMKRIHRMILLSSTYRQSSRSPGAAARLKKDPENRLLWRFGRRRLSAEEIRDAMLAVSGTLNLKAGGESVIVPVDEELVKLLYKPSQWTVTEDTDDHNRRSIYLLAKRNLKIPFMEVFDQPSLQTSCAGRISSTHAPQALELLNGRTSIRLARAFAARLVRDVGSIPSDQVERAFHLAIGRAPTDEERSLSLEFLGTETLEEFTLALFNLNAFLYVN